MKPIPLIGLMCAGIISALTCYGNFPALQPQFETLWSLTKTESGLIFGIFFGGVLDLAGDTTKLGWGLAYASVGLAAFGAPLAVRFVGLRGDPGT